ncbi:MAG TPA: acyltransferase domain-containing protein [Ruminiclostridium sp.]
MKTAYLFTGQGFQYEGMLKELPGEYIKDTMIDTASNILKEDVLKLDSKEALNNNRCVQLCIYISEVILGSLQVERLIPDYVAGHSIGAFSAATISGALDFTDGLQLVSIRGSEMEASYPCGYGMMSVTGLTFELLEQLITEFRDEPIIQNFTNEKKSQVYIANINTKEQLVLSGLLDTLKEVESYLKRKYKVITQMLRVKVPSHCELMLPVSNILDEKMKTIHLKQPKIPYIMNTTARRTRRAEMIEKDLIYGVSKPVYWYDSLSILYELGTRDFLEISQSSVLTEVGKKCYQNAKWRRFV